jgi:hypothetical protein
MAGCEERRLEQAWLAHFEGQDRIFAGAAGKNNHKTLLYFVWVNLPVVQYFFGSYN